jgi:hypothetical protein
MPVVIPDSLIAVQAYVMWEEAGRPQVIGGMKGLNAIPERGQELGLIYRGGADPTPSPPAPPPNQNRAVTLARPPAT